MNKFLKECLTAMGKEEGDMSEKELKEQILVELGYNYGT